MPRSRRGINGVTCILRALLASMLALSSAAWIGAVEPALRESRWSTLGSLHRPQELCAAVELNGKVYALGGDGGFIVEIDLETGRCRILKEMMVKRDFFGVAASGGTIIAMGGLSRTNEFLSAVEIYEVGRNAWRPGASMPTGRNRLAAIAVGQKVYAIGGLVNGNQNTGLVEEYDLMAGAWRKREHMPTARHGHSLVLANEKILAIGGYGDAVPLATVEEFDPKNNRWTGKSEMSVARGFFGAALVDGCVYVIGGRTREIAPVERYDPRSGRWRVFETVKERRNRFGCVGVGDSIYLVGGEEDWDSGRDWRSEVTVSRRLENE